MRKSPSRHKVTRKGKTFYRGKGAVQKSGAGNEFAHLKTMKKGTYITGMNGAGYTYAGFHPEHGHMAEDESGRLNKIRSAKKIGAGTYHSMLQIRKGKVPSRTPIRQDKKKVKKFFRS